MKNQKDSVDIHFSISYKFTLMAILDAKTLPGYFLKRSDLNPEKTALMQKVNGKWDNTPWKNYKEEVQFIALGLRRLGLHKGESVGILSTTRREWAFADLGIICSGLITVPIYSSSTADDTQYILNDATCKALFVENRSQLEKVIKIKPHVPSLKHIITIEDCNHKEIFPTKGWKEIRRLGEEEFRHDRNAFERIANEVLPHDIVTTVYTSGTTGVPKGVELTSEQFLSVIKDCSDAIDLNEKDIILSFLPTAHIVARAGDQMGTIGFGLTCAYAESIEKLSENIEEIRPTFMICVPRIYEKVYAKILGNVKESSLLKQKIFDWSLKTGIKRSKIIERRWVPSPVLRAKYLIADKLVFSKIRAKFGGRLRFFVSGGAPLSSEIARFFHAAGLLILEGWGLTETTGPITLNREEFYKFGTVGLPLKDVQIKIAEDGEILAKSKKIFLGYHNKDLETEDVFINGWFKTGDIGEIDQDGFIKITDRKKDLIVTAGGKNVAPQKIENLLKTSRFISQVLVHGDKRKFLSAIITINMDQIKQYAKENNINFNSEDELRKNPLIYKLLDEEIKKTNQRLASFETVKRFSILNKDFSIEEGELTPSLKVKRNFCEKRYSDILNKMYMESNYT